MRKIKFITAVLLSLIIVFSAGTALVYSYEGENSENAAETNVTPSDAEPQTPSDTPVITPSRPLNYVVIGDSIARGSGVMNHDEASYGRIVADTDGFSYANYGVDGYRSKDILNKTLKRSEVINSISKADIVSISVGGNNYLYSNIIKLLFGGIVFRNKGVLDEVLDPFYSDFCQIIDKIKTLNPDVVIIVQTLYNPVTGLLKDYAKIAIDELNSRFYQYDEEHPGTIHIADVASALDGQADCFAVIHPTAKGNVKIAEVLLALLKELGLGEKTEPVINNKGINTIEFFFGCLLNPKKISVTLPDGEPSFEALPESD